jgi:hypothetical protein
MNDLANLPSTAKAKRDKRKARLQGLGGDKLAERVCRLAIGRLRKGDGQLGHGRRRKLLKEYLRYWKLRANR